MLVEIKEPTYLSAQRIAERYGISKRAVYAILNQIETCGRYEKAWVTLNDGGSRLVNTLVFEDYLRYRNDLKHPNIAKNLPPYDPREVRKQRGELTAVVEKITPKPDEEEFKKKFISALEDTMKEVLRCAKTT